MPDELLTRLSVLPTAALSDVMRRMGRDPNTMHSSMKPVWSGAEVCGPAFTVRTYPGATSGSDLALAQAQPGEVIVLAAGGYTEVILWGEIYSAAATQAGIAGTIIDGAARDVPGVREIGYPLFARAITPRGGTADSTQSETQIPVSCAGIAVRPGDLVRGDEVGVVVVPPEIAEEVIEKAEALNRHEERLFELMRGGASLAEAAKICAEEGV